MSADFKPEEARRTLDLLAAARSTHWDLLERDVAQIMLMYRAGPIWRFALDGGAVRSAVKLSPAEAHAVLSNRGFRPASRLEDQILSTLRLYRAPDDAIRGLCRLFPGDAQPRLLQGDDAQKLVVELPTNVRLEVRRLTSVSDPQLHWSAAEALSPNSGVRAEADASAPALAASSVQSKPVKSAPNKSAAAFGSDDAPSKAEVWQAAAVPVPSASEQERGARAVAEFERLERSSAKRSSAEPVAPQAVSQARGAEQATSHAGPQAQPSAWGESVAVSEVRVSEGDTAHAPASAVEASSGWEGAVVSEARTSGGARPQVAAVSEARLSELKSSGTLSADYADNSEGDEDWDYPAPAPTAGWTPTPVEEDAEQPTVPLGLIFLSFAIIIIFPRGLNWAIVVAIWAFRFWMRRSDD